MKQKFPLMADTSPAADKGISKLAVMPQAVAQATERRITEEDIHQAEQTLAEYKAGKSRLEARIIENEQWYKLRHWDLIKRSTNQGDPEPASAWLLNVIMNKHADAMDNFPAPNVLPRERSDELDAKLLSSILPVVLEQNDFEQAYSDMWWYKLKTGTGVYGVFWDSGKNNGLGDIDIRDIDILNLFWEPGISDIQKSRNLFHVELVDIDLIKEQYPDIADKITVSGVIDVAKYIYDDTVDTSKKTMVVDWYYKIKSGGRDILHYCKFCNGQILYASENDDAYRDRGFYDHGRYPFEFDTLFPEAGTPAGFGYVDICKSPQIYIDKLDQVLLKHSIIASRPRYFARGDNGVNEEEFCDLEKDIVHYSGSGSAEDMLTPIQVPTLSDIYVQIRSLKIDELKETSGNRDFSQGGTASGVTAASAIAALQEAGSKLSRDMIKASYRTFARINYICIELIRQFYSEPRWYRIIGDDMQTDFVEYSNARIQPSAQGSDFGMDMGYRMPYFDITVNSQKASPFSTVAQNERAKELYSMGFYRPDLADQSLAALDMMQFEGIEKARERVRQNGTMYQQIQQLSQVCVQMAAELDRLKGTNYTQKTMMVANGAISGQQTQPQGASSGKTIEEAQANSLGNVVNSGRRATSGEARKKAAQSSTPR